MINELIMISYKPVFWVFLNESQVDFNIPSLIL